MSERIYDLDAFCIYSYSLCGYYLSAFIPSKLFPLNIMKSSNINPFVHKLLRTGDIFFDKMLVVCNNFITFAPIKQKSYGFIIQKK